MRLDGKVVLVTGATSGIGAAIAEGCAAAGATLMLTGRSAERGNLALKQAQVYGVQAKFLAGNLSDPHWPDDIVAETVKRFGRLDVLINNAGMNIRKPVESLALGEWQQVLGTNLTSAFLASRACHPIMKKQGGGKIINIGSMMSIFGASFAPAYAASKGGIVQLTRAMAAGWAGDNIQVNAVLPGWIDTELTRNARAEVAGLHDNVLRRTPAKRWGVEQDMAGVAVFLASPASDFVTGAAIPVDGGYSIQG
jgi:2-dehydro-3-deoxy-D-gluconate 5-dehydrogenase